MPPSTTQWAQLGECSGTAQTTHGSSSILSRGAKLQTAMPFTNHCLEVPSRSARPKAINFPPLWAPPGLRDCQFCKSLAEELA